MFALLKASGQANRVDEVAGNELVVIVVPGEVDAFVPNPKGFTIFFEKSNFFRRKFDSELFERFFERRGGRGDRLGVFAFVDGRFVVRVFGESSVYGVEIDFEAVFLRGDGFGFDGCVDLDGVDGRFRDLRRLDVGGRGGRLSGVFGGLFDGGAIVRFQHLDSFLPCSGASTLFLSLLINKEKTTGCVFDVFRLTSCASALRTGRIERAFRPSATFSPLL